MLVKEIVTIFFIVVFIGEPLIQLIAPMILTLASLIFLVWKRPFVHSSTNLLNAVTELSYLVMFCLFFSLKVIKLEDTNIRHNIGKVIIISMVVIIFRCLVDMVIGLIEIGIWIKKRWQRSTPAGSESQQTVVRTASMVRSSTIKRSYVSVGSKLDIDGKDKNHTAKHDSQKKENVVSKNSELTQEENLTGETPKISVKLKFPDQ